MAGLDATGLQQVLGIVQGQALKIIGGVPILKNLKGSTNELLKLPKHLDIGNVGSLLQKVLQNGIGSVLQNPLGAVANLANGALNDAISQVTDALGSVSAPLTNAMGALQSSISTVSSLAGSLSGALPVAGLPTNLDLMCHAGLSSGFGASLPAGLGIDVASAPLMLGPQISAMADQVSSLANAVVAGSMSVNDAVAAIAGLQATIDQVNTASTTAISTLQAQAAPMASVQSAVACLVPGAVPSELTQAMTVCFQPSALPLAQQVAAQHLARVMSVD